jgi:hypothetical protein
MDNEKNTKHLQHQKKKEIEISPDKKEDITHGTLRFLKYY